MTGSSTPNHKGILHSGAGRIARLKMATMTSYEANDSSGEISLQSLFDHTFQPKLTGEVHLMDIISMIVRGGWPASIGMPLDQAMLLPKEYIEAIIQDDIYHIDNRKRDTNKIRLLLRSLARNESTTAYMKTLQKDIKEIDNEDIDTETIADYLNLFSRLFLIENQRPFSSQVRSSIRVKQAEERHFCDPSLACALLNLTLQRLLQDLETLDSYLKLYANVIYVFMENPLVLLYTIIKIIVEKKLMQF